MKKLLVAIFALLYISTSIGATVHMHYCMGKLADWGIGHNESKTFGRCGMEQSEQIDTGCCKDEHKFLKNDTDQKTAETAFQLAQLTGIALPVLFYEMPGVRISTLTEANPTSHAPPPDRGIAVYIRNCTFLI